MISLGCPKNLVDSEVMLGLAQQAGHELTREAAEADVLVVNTCAFIDEARKESVDTILELDASRGEGTRLVVTGCMAERGDRSVADHRIGDAIRFALERIVDGADAQLRLDHLVALPRRPAGAVHRHRPADRRSARYRRRVMSTCCDVHSGAALSSIQLLLAG